MNEKLFDAPALVYLTLGKGHTGWPIYDLGAFGMTLMLAAKDHGVDSIPAYEIGKFPGKQIAVGLCSAGFLYFFAKFLTFVQKNSRLLFCPVFVRGAKIINGKAEYLMPGGGAFPKTPAEQLLGHNFQEFTNLAKILPSIYEEEKDTCAIPAVLF